MAPSPDSGDLDVLEVRAAVVAGVDPYDAHRGRVPAPAASAPAVTGFPRIASALLTSNLFGASTASFVTVPSLDHHRVALRAHAETEASVASSSRPSAFAKAPLRVGRHHHVADLLVLAPGIHDEGVVDGGADNAVPRLLPYRVGVCDVAGQVLLGTQRRERAGHGEQHDLLAAEQVLGAARGRPTVLHDEKK